ncbi:hypothetical protein IB286_10995 [Spongiibacter sp. KMU-158]|uniref:TraX protein n=1 Tax=Spongiibacter pelagi TaxID=2760804 RepID=A0A927GWA7_9GAMM|nr:TraX family protein [Spongiibacter pelagi]MBD2859531.1 hypothetical protein [Spongiibacter pelagi]
MTSFQLKIIALLSMIIDHIGLFFFPQFEIFRIVGRLAFPLFAWLVANGAQHTRDLKQYVFRLALLALVAQPPFWFANKAIGAPNLILNTVFTLCLGLLVIGAIKRFKNRWIWLAMAVACSSLAAIFNTDYGIAGVLSVAAFYIFRNHFKVMLAAQGLLLGVAPLLIHLLQTKHSVDLSRFYFSSPIEFWSLAALVLIYFRNKNGSPHLKYLFYIIYPLQYVIILLVYTFLVYGNPYYPILRTAITPNFSLLYIGTPVRSLDQCQAINLTIENEVKSSCPTCEITSSICPRNLEPELEATVDGKSEDYWVVRTETHHIRIEGDNTKSEVVCSEIAKQINAQTDQKAQCLMPQQKVRK